MVNSTANANRNMYCMKSALVMALVKPLPKPASALKKVAEGGQALEIEYSESCDNDDLGVDMRGDFWHFLHAFLADERFDEDEKSVVKSPKNEVPACAVPKTRAEPNEEKSAVLAASAKYRHIEQVVAEKSFRERCAISAKTRLCSCR